MIVIPDQIHRFHKKFHLKYTKLTDSAICDLVSRTREMPKSPNFTSPDLVKNMFKVFMSLIR